MARLFAQIHAEQRHGQRVRTELQGERFQFRICGDDAGGAQQGSTRPRVDLLEVAHRHAGPSGQADEGLSRRDDAQPRRLARHAAEERIEGRIAQLTTSS